MARGVDMAPKDFGVRRRRHKPRSKKYVPPTIKYDWEQPKRNGVESEEHAHQHPNSVTGSEANSAAQDPASQPCGCPDPANDGAARTAMIDVATTSSTTNPSDTALTRTTSNKAVYECGCDDSANEEEAVGVELSNRAIATVKKSKDKHKKNQNRWKRRHIRANNFGTRMTMT